MAMTERFRQGDIWLTLFKALVGVALLVILFAKIDLHQFWVAFEKADPVRCTLGFILFGLMGLAESFRLMVTLSSYSVRFATALYLYLVGMFFANFMPGNLGAEVYRVYFLSRLEPGLSRPIALMFLLRMTGLGVLLLLLLSYLPFHVGELAGLLSDRISLRLPGGHPALYAIALVTVLAACFFLSRTAFGRSACEKIGAAIGKFVEALTALSLLRYLGIVLLSLVVHGFRMFFFYMFVSAFGIDMNFLDLIPVAALVVFASLLPISFASLGVREGAIVGGLYLFGVPQGVALAVAVLARFSLLVVSLLGGAVFAIGKRGSATT